MTPVRQEAILVLASLLLCGAMLQGRAAGQAPDADFDRNARRAAPRDAFPVFNNPRLVPARSAGLADGEWVIGVVVNGEARAYPVAVMGVHELGNDTCGGEPIAVSW